MRLLADAILPETVESEAPPGSEVVRWTGGEDSDEDLIRAAAHEGFRGVVFFDRRSVYQPGLRDLARSLGVGLIAVDADDPIDAKDRLFHNLAHIRSALQSSTVVLVLADEVRPLDVAPN